MVSEAQYSEFAREELVGDDKAEELRVVRESHTGATPTFMLILDLGWCEKIVACKMYKDDACGVAYALAVVLDCPKVVLP